MASSNAVAWSGNDATLTLASGQTIQNDYLASETYVSSAVDAGQVAGTASNYSVTSTAGTFDDAGNPITVDAIGGVYQDWTLSFTSATAFDLVGDEVGNVGSGTISGDFSPNNSNFSKPFLTIPAAAFGGTFQAGDQITFRTTPFAVPIWLKQYVPASSAAGNSNFTFFFDVS